MGRVSSEVVTISRVADIKCVIKYGVLVLEREWLSTQCAVRVCRVPHLFAKVRKDDVIRWPVALFHGRCVQTVVLFGQHRREGLERWPYYTPELTLEPSGRA
jgi:hypothetical protein